MVNLAVSSKLDLDHLSQDIQELWDEWQLGTLMLLSLSLQIFLTIFGNLRKYTVGVWLGNFLWLAYLSADWAATFSLGILARSEANSTNPNLIPVFWAPMLLVHLGGPETITVYSIDQVEKLWLSRLLHLVTHIVGASYVLFRLWSKNSITLVAIPIFISGIIKYAERIRVFRSARSETFVGYENDHVPSQPSVKASCIGFEDIYSSNEGTKDEVRCLHEAHVLFKTSQMLFKNFDLTNLDQNYTYELVSNKKAKEAFKLTEVELGFMYDRFYSKLTEVSMLRIILHYITFLSSISALVFFSIMTTSKNVYSKSNTAISYLLLVGAVLLESYFIIVLLLSDWSLLWLSRSGIAVRTLSRINCVFPLLTFCRERRRWSRSMAQHNLISAQSKTPENKILKYFPWKRNIHSQEDVDKDLRELIFQQIQDKRSRYNPRTNNFIDLTKLLEERGHGVLQSYHCFEELGWSVADVEFIHSLLTWHIAIHVCYYFYDFQNKYVQEDPNSKMSRLLSNYMLYLLVECPAMLPGEHSETSYRDTSIHLSRSLFWNTHKGSKLDHKLLEEWKASLTKGFKEAEVVSFFSELLQGPSAMLNEIKEEDEGEKSALLDGCMLAMSLQSLEKKDGWSNEKKWEMVSKVWVDMLMYAASHCGWKEHARRLARGGELLTHVCLLMAHLGLSKQSPPEVSEQLVERSKRLEIVEEFYIISELTNTCIE